MQAGDLRPGQWLQESDGTWQEVIDSRREEHSQGITVYNFEVESDHTYFVADAETSFSDPIWVHNDCSPRASLARTLRNRDYGRKKLRTRLEESLGSGAMIDKDAHHLIPLELLDDPKVGKIIRAAARDGFDINGLVNAAAVPSGHGPHADYTAYVRDLILQNSGGGTGGASGILSQVAGVMRQDIGFWFDP